MINSRSSTTPTALKVAVIGTGYVGLVTGACLAKWGHEVSCVDRDNAKIMTLKGGHIPMYEPGLEKLVTAGMDNGNLKFSTETPRSVSGADVIFIAVGTPQQLSDGQSDLSAIYAVAREIAPSLKPGAIVAVKSTVPVGTGDIVEGIIVEIRDSADIVVISNPEFLKEGAAIADFLNPDRIIVGTESDVVHSKMRLLYKQALDFNVPLLFTRRRTAELTKASANAFLATKISFMNELADLCEKVGADVLELASGLGLDKRIGRDFLNPGPGYGGSCLPKDAVALLHTARDHEVSLNIIKQAVQVNENRKLMMTRKIVHEMQGNIVGQTIAVLGLSFKPNTDDMRESPAIALIQSLQKLGAKIRAYDPVAMKQAQLIFTGVEYTKNCYDCAKGADALVIVTEWSEFGAMDLAQLQSTMAGRVVVDLRNILDMEDATKAGLQLTGVGRTIKTASSLALARSEVNDFNAGISTRL